MTPLTRLIIVALGGFAITMGLVLYLVDPTLDQVARLNEELREKKIESKTLDQQILAFKTAESDLSKTTDKDRLTDAIVAREELADAIIDLEQAAVATQTVHTLNIVEDDSEGTRTTKTKEPNVVPGAAGVEEIVYNLNTRNNFIGTVNFLKYLEHLPHFTEVSGIEMVAQPAGGQSGVGANTGQIISNINGVFFIKNESQVQ